MDEVLLIEGLSEPVLGTVPLAHPSSTTPFAQCPDEHPSAGLSQFAASAFFTKPSPSFSPGLPITRRAFHFTTFTVCELYTDHCVAGTLVLIISFQTSALLTRHSAATVTFLTSDPIQSLCPESRTLGIFR